MFESDVSVFFVTVKSYYPYMKIAERANGYPKKSLEKILGDFKKRRLKRIISNENYFQSDNINVDE